MQEEAAAPGPAPEEDEDEEQEDGPETWYQAGPDSYLLFSLT